MRPVQLHVARHLLEHRKADRSDPVKHVNETRQPTMLLLLGLAFCTVLIGCVPATPAAAPSASRAARLVVADSRDQTRPWPGNLVRPVDPDTMVDLRGFSPVDFASCGGALPGPDGRLLAIATGWLGPEPRAQYPACNVGGGVELRLFDLEAWAWVDRDLGLRTDSVSPIAWSPDGKRLYAVASTYARGPVRDLSAQDVASRLWIIDPTGATAPNSTPLEYAAHSIRLASDGSALYVLGYNRDPTERALLATDSAFLVVLDPSTGAEQARILLPDLKVGQRRQTDAQGRAEYWTFYPGLALAPDSSRYYVARAHEALLDVIDLRARRIERTIRTDVATASAVEWFLDLFAGSAVAKGGPAGAALLAASPDGHRLYTRLYGRDLPAMADVFVIDTGSWRVRRLGPKLPNITPSLDGRWLYRRDDPPSSASGGSSERLQGTDWSGAGVRVLEASTGREVATLVTGRLVDRIVQRGTDRLYVAMTGPDWHPTPPYLKREGEAVRELVAYQVGTWQELGRRAGHWRLRIATDPS
jgi:hypothetical protein